eukprot:5032238-Amphidinium_carterae.1
MALQIDGNSEEEHRRPTMRQRQEKSASERAWTTILSSKRGGSAAKMVASPRGPGALHPTVVGIPLHGPDEDMNMQTQIGTHTHTQS